MAKLTEVADIQYGYAFDSKNFTDDASYPQLVRIRDIKRGFSETFYKGEYSKDYVLYAGDLLVGMDGEFNVARWKVDGALLNQRVCKIMARPNTDEEYLRFILRKILKKIEVMTSFVTVKHLSAKELNNTELDIPKYEEQVHRAKILLKLEAIIDKRQSQLDKLDELVRARFVEMFGDVKANPYGFEKMALKDTCTVITGNTPSRSVPEYYGDSIEWIKTDNIVSGQLRPSQALEYLSDEGIKVGRTVEKGAILMACIAGSVASIGRVCITDRKVAFNQQINAIVSEDYDSLFLHTMLQLSKEYLAEEINMALKGILSKSKLEGKEFIVPPIEQQKQFANFVAQVNKSKLLVASQPQIHIYKTLTLL